MKSARPRRVVLLYANDVNIGDYLSAQGIDHHLGGVDIAVAFERHRPLVRRILQSIGQGDLVIVGGGGLLKSTFDSFWQFFADIAAAQNFDYALWGVGYCDVKAESTRGNEALLQRIVGRSVAAGLRDRMSLEPYIGFEHAELVPCPSIALVRGFSLEADRQRDLVLRVDHPGLIESLAHKATGTVAVEANQLVARTARQMGLGLATVDNLVPGPQRRIPVRVSARLAPTAIQRRVTKYRVRTVLAMYQRASLVVTTRLHGAILGAASGARVIALSADRKIEGFFELLDAPQWVVENSSELEAALASVGSYEHPTQQLDAMIGQSERFAAHLIGLPR